MKKRGKKFRRLSNTEDPLSKILHVISTAFDEPKTIDVLFNIFDMFAVHRADVHRLDTFLKLNAALAVFAVDVKPVHNLHLKQQPPSFSRASQAHICRITGILVLTSILVLVTVRQRGQSVRLQ